VPITKNPDISFDLADIGCPELRVTIRDPRDLPAGIHKELTKGEAVMKSAQKKKELDAEDLWAVDAFDKAFVMCLKEWNLEYDEDSYPHLAGQVIPVRKYAIQKELGPNPAFISEKKTPDEPPQIEVEVPSPVLFPKYNPLEFVHPAIYKGLVSAFGGYLVGRSKRP
jgi:hypothetical protein